MFLVQYFRLLLAAILATKTGATRGFSSSLYPIVLEIKHALDSRLANIHVSCSDSTACVRAFTLTYGPCNVNSKHLARHTIGTLHSLRNIGRNADLRLAWVIPEDAESGSCLSAWDAGVWSDGLDAREVVNDSRQTTHRLLGRSNRLRINRLHRQWRKAKRHLAVKMNNASGIDVDGPWFDGVELLKNREPRIVDVKKAKAKKIAIVGAGMSGLMTWLCLNNSGFHNIEILEAGERLGGRVHTEYLQGGPFDYQYQEMGPMRFPESIKYAGANESLPVNDMKLVFQLADKLNILNDFSQNYTISFIDWLETSNAGLYYFNGIKRPDGVAPTLEQVESNPKRWTFPTAKDGPQLIKAQNAYSNIVADPKTIALAATNMFEAHKKFLDTGLNGLEGDDWSEFSYIHNHLKFSLNLTDDVLGIGGYPEVADSFWGTIIDSEYFGATSWKTVDGGLNRIPYAFYPLVGNITRMSHRVSGLYYSPAADKITLSWKRSLLSATYNTSYDYAVVAVPFTIVRGWRYLSNFFNPTIQHAISNVPYGTACKVILQFRTRFWEHYKDPIFGSCSTSTDIPGIGFVCYPSYNLRASGPGVIIASYIVGDLANQLVSWTEKEHVQYVLDATIEIHGDVARQQYTGRHARLCWVQDPLEQGGWADPSAGMHKLYIPEYLKVHNNVIFVGEHTSYTQAWIASALESGIRGSVQLMLEMGLVDEAKAITKEWMARWISV